MTYKVLSQSKRIIKEVRPQLSNSLLKRLNGRTLYAQINVSPEGKVICSVAFMDRDPKLSATMLSELHQVLYDAISAWQFRVSDIVVGNEPFETQLTFKVENNQLISDSDRERASN
jgi:hypothetical protein